VTVTKGWDHDPPAKEKLVPFGILTVATGALMPCSIVRDPRRLRMPRMWWRVGAEAPQADRGSAW